MTVARVTEITAEEPPGTFEDVLCLATERAATAQPEGHVITAEPTAEMLKSEAATRREALALTTVLLTRMPLPLPANDAADFAVCVFQRVLDELTRVEAARA
jgi:hypothetical protein